jgi:hypothetical protein
MFYKEFKETEYGKQLVVDIEYREGDRRIKRANGLPVQGLTSHKVPRVRQMVKLLPGLLPGVDKLEIEPAYGYDYAIILNAQSDLKFRKSSRVT